MRCRLRWYSDVVVNVENVTVKKCDCEVESVADIMKCDS